MKGLWAAVLSTWALLAAGASPVFELPHHVERLPNGLRIFLVKYPSPGVIAYQLPVRVGSRNEVEKGKTGFAHFFEHLMFRGTKSRGAKEFGELFARLGAENNAWTWFDMTNYHGVVSKGYLSQILTAEADRFRNLSFDEKALKDEAGAVMGEYNKSVAQPEFALEEKLQETAFTVHPYGHTTMGYKQDIARFTERYPDVWPFFRRYYRPGSVSVVLVGDVDFSKHGALVRKELGSWVDPEEKPAAVPQEPPQEGPREGTVAWSKPTQTRIAIAHRVPAFSTAGTDGAVLPLLAEMAFSVTSDFQKTYRFERKWIDSVDAGPIQTLDPGLWTVTLRLSEAGEGKEAELRKAAQEVLAGFAEKKVPPRLLEATKRRLKNGAVAGWFRTPDKLADRIAWFTNFEPDIGVLNRFFERVESVTPDDLAAFAKKIFVESNRTTVVLRGAKS